jgi:toxin ParE1/3/4
VKLEWSEQSKSDLTSIRDYISRDSEYYADRMVQRLIMRAERILQHPSSGHSVHEFPEVKLKEVHEDPYRIIYKWSKVQVEIVTIVHFRQILKKDKIA